MTTSQDGEAPDVPQDGASSDDVVVRPDGEQGEPVRGLGTMGMAVFLASLSMLFVASLLGFLLIRFKAEVWPPPGAPPIPWSLWLSTLLALGCSGTMQLGLNAIRAGSNERLNRWLLVTNLLALLFLAVQSLSWWQFYDPELLKEHLYAFTFYMLTVLHAAHVVGGMISLVFVTVRAKQGAYNWANYAGIKQSTLYWHFLDVVWLVLFATLLLTS